MLFALSRAWDKEKILWRIEPQTVGFWAPMLCQRPSEVQILISAFSFSFVLCSWSDESCPFLFLNILYRDVMLFWSFFDQVRCGLHICFVFFFFYRRGYKIVRDTVSFLQTALIWVKNDTFCSILYSFFTHCRLINLVFTSLSQEFR